MTQTTNNLPLLYRVGTLRHAGLLAKWSRTRSGAPIIVARKSDATPWYAVTDRMWKRAAEVGIAQAFDEHTALARYFSIPL
jgi:hypothetical protein